VPLAQALSNCSCSYCDTECIDDLCNLESPSPTCNSCTLSYCNTQVTACFNDAGGEG
jgi:hypothetical protein